MSWDPNSALVVYQPIDFYALVTQEVSKSINNVSVELEKLTQDLEAHKPQAQGSWKGRTVSVISTTNRKKAQTAIEKLKLIQSSIATLSKTLEKGTKGFERALALKINPVNEKIAKLNEASSSLLDNHLKILGVQNEFAWYTE